MRLWKAIGDASLVLLLATLSLGPVARLRLSVGRWLRWRRELGIWFGVLAVVHAVLVLNGWARWSLARLLGYEFVTELGRTARMEPGFGLANVLGLLALAWTLVLVATSTDRAVRWLGPRAWKWLHNASHTVFYLVTAHVGYFLFIHYTLSFHRDPPPPDWFRAPFVLLATGVVALQFAAFVATARRRKSRPQRAERAHEHAWPRPFRQVSVRLQPERRRQLCPAEAQRVSFGFQALETWNVELGGQRRVGTPRLGLWTAT